MYALLPSKPKLPIEVELQKQQQMVEPTEGSEEPEWDADTLLQQADLIAQLKEKIFKKAKANIDEVQRMDKMYYDQKHSDQRVTYL